MNVTGSALYETSGTGCRNKHSNNADAFRNNRLRLDADGKLVCIVSGDAGYSLGIRPKSASAARPGDDLLLSFGLRTRSSSEALSFIGPEGTIVKAHKTLDESDYLAVYDKKLLWRANLYITESDGRDWNDVHPWNAPPDNAAATSWSAAGTMPNWWSADWGYNEWNRVHTDQDQFNISNLETGNGTQDTIKPHAFTWFRGNNIKDRVAYEYWGQDSPFEFNFKMYNQKKILDYAIKNGLYGFVQNPAGHNFTTAPSGGDNPYRNYIRSSGYGNFPTWYDPTPGTISISPEGTYKVLTTTAPADGAGVTINNVLYRAYMPSLSNHLVENAFPNEILATVQTPESLPTKPMYIGSMAAGTDCVGFVQRSASYQGSSYTWITANANRNLGSFFWGTTRGETAFPYTQALRPGVNASCKVLKKLEAGQQPNNLDKVIPGDMFFFYDGEEGSANGRHIAMVQSVTPAADGSITLANIQLVESTYSGNVGNIVNQNSVENITTSDSQKDRKWIIVRLKK